MSGLIQNYSKEMTMLSMFCILVVICSECVLLISPVQHLKKERFSVWSKIFNS